MLHSDFPHSPFDILEPEIRWFPADESLRENGMEKLLPPFVAELRKAVKIFRNNNYAGASQTSRSLLNWWFNTPHLIEKYNAPSEKFQYFFAQREALETIIYLYEVVGVRDKFDLIPFDCNEQVNANMFDETWRRFVVKMATGSGKTKVLSLVLAWSFFHKLYEPESTLARNFLIITPNIIVLDRIRRDFDRLRIFSADPVIPDNGFNGQNWRNDFQLTVHIQDNVRITHSTGNIFLTNVHRVFLGNEIMPSPDDDNLMDYFFGKRPTGKTLDSKIDLGTIIRDIDELMILNDEAHHIHDSSLAWFQSIQDIHNRLLQKDSKLSLQIDTTATPKHNNGSIFVQTIADYPLVEAIAQNVVKHPVLPDVASREKLHEKLNTKYTEKYADYIHLGVIEWKKAFAEHEKMGKKAIFFVMTDDTRNCDEVKEYLENHYPELRDAVLVIHTKNNGEISESSTGKSLEELEELRKQANEIDHWENKYKAIVSVMMLKEGWDVQNVTTIVGLRAYSSKSNILPEQTLGRGLRKMYSVDVTEYVSVIGTNAFMEFVETIRAEGVELERAEMGEKTKPQTPLIIEIDKDNSNKDMDTLDLIIPIMTPRCYREYQCLNNIDETKMEFQKQLYHLFTEEEQREIVFKDIVTNEIVHDTQLDTEGIVDFRDVLRFFAEILMKELHLVSGYDVLYLKLKIFVREQLFGQTVDLESPNTVRNLSESDVTKTVIETFKKQINSLTVYDQGSAEISGTIQLRNTRPFWVNNQEYLLPKKSVFRRLIWDSELEHRFIQSLEKWKDVESFAKNFIAVGFKLDYINQDGDVTNYYPDFFVRPTSKGKPRLVIVETKGREDLDVPHKMSRLSQWCEDVNQRQNKIEYLFVYVDEENFDKYQPTSFNNLIEMFQEYQK
ncbi:MAG: DEAD/DEAH box helicase family protein [Planctomycetaceae bacterium]|jgi:type III restriction enzyme|nr:DEAD/DEAH box helicase family protein [Planctomycetaceae bacterium]